MAAKKTAMAKGPMKVGIFSCWPVLFAFCIFSLHSLFFFYWIIDDAGISFVYARNLIHGHGLVSQVGAVPVEGFSNPLWTFLIAPLFISNPFDPTLIVKIISLLLVLLTFVTIHKIVAVLISNPFLAAFASLATLSALSVNTSFVVWTTSGMENPLYALLSVLCCLSLLLYSTKESEHAKYALLSGLAVSGLALTRPDGIVFIFAFFLIALFAVSDGIRRWGLAARDSAVFFLAAAVPISLYLGFRIIYFKNFLPNTYYVKGGPSLRDFLYLLILKKNYIDKTYDLIYSMVHVSTGLLIIFLLFCGIFVILKVKRSLPFISSLAMLFCSWAIYCLLPKDWMREFRFATPFLVFFYLNAFVLTAEALRQTERLPVKLKRLAFGIFGVALLSLSIKVYLPRTLAFADKPTAPFSFVAYQFGHTFNYYADMLGMTEASFLCPDMGGTLYYSRLKVYDLVGLCDPKFAKLIQNGQALRDYVLDDLKPTFIHVHDCWSIDTGFQFDPRFKRIYIPIRELISKWENKRMKGTKYLNGDYVRKDSIRDMEKLDLLSRQIDAKRRSMNVCASRSQNQGAMPEKFLVGKFPARYRLPFASWASDEARRATREKYGLETSLLPVK